MDKLQIIHGYINGEIKWCVVCVNEGLQNTPLRSKAFDTRQEAGAELERLKLLAGTSSPRQSAA
jgi:hypothetical protein